MFLHLLQVQSFTVSTLISPRKSLLMNTLNSALYISLIGSDNVIVIVPDAPSRVSNPHVKLFLFVDMYTTLLTRSLHLNDK